MKRVVFCVPMLLLPLVALLPAFLLAGCGGSGGGGCDAISGYVFGRQEQTSRDVAVALLPLPNASMLHFTRPVVAPGTAPKIVIDRVTQFAGQIHPECTGIYQNTSQFVAGRAFNVISTEARVYVYAETDRYYIQPIFSSYATIEKKPDGNSPGLPWYAPANPGNITVLLTSNTFTAADTYEKGALPAVDGVNVLAVASQP